MVGRLVRGGKIEGHRKLGEGRGSRLAKRLIAKVEVLAESAYGTIGVIAIDEAIVIIVSSIVADFLGE